MSYYRELNKELVEQVQIMRENTKIYVDEIRNLKAELAQKYESEVFLRKQCYNWAVDNFLQLIETVQPYSDILPILKEHTQPQERISSGHRYSDTLRRSSRLTIELQRSNSVINTRKSLCSTSPIRRSSKTASSYENDEQEVDQVEKNKQDNELEVTKKTQEPLQNADSENIIYEESEEYGEEEDDIFEVYNESTNESFEEITVDVSSKSLTLKDVTNTTKDLLKTDNSLSKVVRKKGRPKKMKETNLSDSENITDYTTSMDLDCDTDMERSASSRRTKNRTNNSVINVSQETLEEPRMHTRHSDLTYMSLPIDQDQTKNDVTLSSHMSVITDMTLKHFKNAACSTPNSRNNSLRKSTAQPNASLEPAQETTPISADTEFSTRPSRQCKPKNLAEAKINSKLRNESETRKKSRHKAKAKKQ